MKELLDGLKYMLSSFGYLRRSKLSYVYLISLCLIILYTIVNVNVSSYISEEITIIVDYWFGRFEMPEWLNVAVSATAKIATSIICFMAVATLGGSIIMILLSPLFSHIAEKISTQLTGKKYTFSWSLLFRQILRGVGISLRNMLIQYLIIFVLFFFSFFPAFGWICNIAIFVVNAFFYGFTLMDYAFETRMLSVKNSISYANANKLSLIGLGLPFALCMFIPFVGAYLAAFVVPATVVGATRFLNREVEDIE